MEIRTAILKAADSIERNPELFDFWAIKIPDCRTPGCALGWIARHIGQEAMLDSRLRDHNKTKQLLGAGDMKFYLRMNDLSLDWKGDPKKCAKALRLYADKFHPADKPNYTGIPPKVLALFAEKVAA